MEVIKEKICQTKYRGNCPVCGEIQTSKWESSVDTICLTCEFKEKHKKVKDDLIGAIIIDVVCEDDLIKTIILKKPGEPNEIEIEVLNNYEDGCELIYTVK